MPYTEAARERRRCTGTRKDGSPCRAWALWDDPEQRCFAHAGRHHTGPLPETPAGHRHAAAEACTCEAYAWPHRPGSGLCRWPGEPERRHLQKAGEHASPRLREDSAFMRNLREMEGDAAVDAQLAEIRAMMASATGGGSSVETQRARVPLKIPGAGSALSDAVKRLARSGVVKRLAS